jgi:hypothetical protein
MRFLRLARIGAALWMSACSAQEPAGTSGDASADACTCEDVSADQPFLDSKTYDGGSSDAPGVDHAVADHVLTEDGPTDFDVADGGRSDVPELGDATIDGGTCPSPMAQGTDRCRFCPGMACQAGDECDSMYHQGGPASTHCTCVNGWMQCCFASLTSGGPTYMSCDYGTLPPPTCPPGNPRIGDACGPDLQLCGLPTCCTGFIPGAYCDGLRWISGSSSSCNRPPSWCAPGQAPIVCTVQETVLTCTCEQVDAGDTMWQCDGPG